MNPQLNKVFSKLAKADKKTELKSEKVELGLVQDILKDYQTLKKKVESLTNKASKLESDHQKVMKMAKAVGVDMDAEFIKAGKFLKKIKDI